MKEEIGRKCEALSFGTNFGMKEFEYSKLKRTKKLAKEARNIYESSSESSVEVDSYSEEETSEDPEGEEPEGGKTADQKPKDESAQASAAPEPKSTTAKKAEKEKAKVKISR